jgi:hypothetical protein
VEFEVSKIDAAVAQLDWAIRLFLDHKAYVPAITLAAAAEEILGKAVPGRSASELPKHKLGDDFGYSAKVLNDHYLNEARNWLKHWARSDGSGKIRLKLDEEALQYIIRALTNLAAHDASQPSEGPRFWAWMSENRLDLLK